MKPKAYTRHTCNMLKARALWNIAIGFHLFHSFHFNRASAIMPEPVSISFRQQAHFLKHHISAGHSYDNPCGLIAGLRKTLLR